MKMSPNIIIKSYKYYKDNLLSIMFSTAVVALVFWYQISPFSFNEYNVICKSNYGAIKEFNRCMNPYWSQYSINRIGIIVALILFSVSAILVVINYINKHQA